jgi:hypothetical protein
MDPMLVAIAIAAATVSGVVFDALTGAPVHGAVVTDGRLAISITDGQGRFQLAGPGDGPIDVIVQHPSYSIFAQARVPQGTRVEIRLRPSSIEAEPLEIVETREQDLRPMLLRQDPIVLPAHYTWEHSGLVQLKGVYRVCVGTDGKVALVVALQPAGRSADPYIKESIANGWQYKPLAKPACFAWRVTLFLGVPAPNPMSPVESAAPPPDVPVERPR